MKKNKLKIAAMSVGTIGTIVAPVASLVACGGKTEVRHFNLLPTYTGQIDQLIALGVHADYYPLQLEATAPYEYLLNPGKFMVKQSDEFKAKFQKRLADLMPKTKGTSWWNQQALDSKEDKGSDPSYWQQQEGGVVLYEHYLLDDDAKVIDSSIAPKHVDEAVVQTNFRSSRDPYTRIPKAVFFGWDLTDAEVDAIIAGTTKDVTINIKKKPETVTVTAADAKVIKNLRDKRHEFYTNTDEKTKGTSDWLYNDYYFVDNFHRMFLDNADFQNSDFAEWIIDSSVKNPFDSNKTNAGYIKQLFDASTFQSDEIKGGVGPSSVVAAHHPIYEQQEGEIGAAPMFEGAMRDNQLYLFNLSWQLSNLAEYGTPFGQSHLASLPDTIAADKRDNTIKLAQSKEEANLVKNQVAKSLTTTQLAEVKAAFTNANKISSDMHKRLTALKTYFEALKTAAGQKDKLTYGLLTIAPGAGQSTIQTMSKYSFIFNELGFAQPMAKNVAKLAAGADKFTKAWTSAGTNPYLTADAEGALLVNDTDADVKEAVGSDALFNMDDNGWFWVLGEKTDLDTEKMKQFDNQFDLGSIAARQTNFDSTLSQDKASNAPVAANMFKAGKGKTGDDAVNFLKGNQVDYDLWNEGLKTPFVMHMILDKIELQMEQWYEAHKPTTGARTLADIQKDAASKYTEATSWGTYFADEYVAGF